MAKPLPKVSVFMITYNHEPFLDQALQSILMQKTNFPFEIVIGEDCSTDNTRSILRAYKREFPDKIKLILHDSNVGPMNNQLQTMRECTGDFVAALEGDDFWNDPYKLQKQVDFLESNENFSACYSMCYDVFEDKGNSVIAGKEDPYVTDTRRLLKDGWSIRTATLMYRNYTKEISFFPDWYREVYSADYALQVLLSSKGPLGKIDGVMASYRRHAGGVSISDTRKTIERYKQVLWLLGKFDSHFHYQYSNAISEHKRRINTTILSFGLRNKMFTNRHVLYSLLRADYSILKTLAFSYLKRRVAKSSQSTTRL